MNKYIPTTRGDYLVCVWVVGAMVVACHNFAESQSAVKSGAAPGAKQSEVPKTGAAKTELQLRSTAFKPYGVIPKKYTCEGKDLSPPLSWSGLPKEAKSLVLIVDDPDAPDPKAPKMTWVHWVVFNIPTSVTALSEGVVKLPAGAKEGISDFKRKSYGGPCPPIGRHRYYHKLYALDTLLALEQPTKAEVEKAMQSHVLAKAELVGTYQKSDALL